MISKTNEELIKEIYGTIFLMIQNINYKLINKKLKKYDAIIFYDVEVYNKDYKYKQKILELINNDEDFFIFKLKNISLYFMAKNIYIKTKNDSILLYVVFLDNDRCLNLSFEETKILINILDKYLSEFYIDDKIIIFKDEKTYENFLNDIKGEL